MDGSIPFLDIRTGAFCYCSNAAIEGLSPVRVGPGDEGEVDCKSEESRHCEEKGTPPPATARNKGFATGKQLGIFGKKPHFGDYGTARRDVRACLARFVTRTLIFKACDFCAYLKRMKITAYLLLIAHRYIE